MDCRHTIGLTVIGDPCALKRWQDHHSTVVVFFFLTHLRGTDYQYFGENK